MMSKLKFYFSLLLLGLNVEFQAQEDNIVSYFYGKHIGESVVLNFEMRAGNSCFGIQIERRSGNNNFAQIGVISGVCGNEDYPEQYVFIDDAPIKNTLLFYRLIFNGLGISQELEILVPNYLEAGYTVALDPNTNQLALYFRNPLEVEVDLVVHDTFGRVVYELSTNQNYFLLSEIPLNNALFFFRIFSKDGKDEINGKLFLN